ncbi:MAG: hypothetical protein LBH01_02130 [Verrucomicrobiales bacterium]|jgi:hypothetical protein|nr:hypothetical protein [Verrucomicrobiales bacterium]
MKLHDIIIQAEARLRADGQWPPVNGEGYDLNDPQLRAELLNMDEVHFRLNPLPPEIQNYLDGLNRPMSDSEQDVICDYLDRVFDLAPDFGTSRGDDGKSIWVFEHEQSRKRKLRDPEFRRRMRGFAPKNMTTYDLQQWKDMLQRLAPKQ